MLQNFLSNRFTQIAAAVAIPLAFFADFFGSALGYLFVGAVMLLLLLLGYFDERKKSSLYKKPNLPIPIVFNVSNPADSVSALDALFEKLKDEYPDHKESLQKYFNIIESDLIFKYDGDIFDEVRFVDFLKITKHEIKKLESKTPQNVHYHVVYIGPIANAILIGTMFGTEGLTLYQYNKSSDSYTIALEVKGREYKEHVSDFKIIKKSLHGKIKKGDSVDVAIDLASHKVALGKLKEPVVHLESTIGATIKEPQDFIRANQEIYAVINDLQQQAGHIRLVYSMPTTVAILLGMSIQNYWDIELTQFSDGQYKSVIKHLNQIKYYF